MERQKTKIFSKVYEVVFRIPKGKVTTYGEIGRCIGISPRVVGWALHANSDPKNIPCHRVVKKDGSLAPGYAFGGPNEQKYRLLSEGVVFLDDLRVDLGKCRYSE